MAEDNVSDEGLMWILLLANLGLINITVFHDAMLLVSMGLLAGGVYLANKQGLLK